MKLCVSIFLDPSRGFLSRLETHGYRRGHKKIDKNLEESPLSGDMVNIKDNDIFKSAVRDHLVKQGEWF